MADGRLLELVALSVAIVALLTGVVALTIGLRSSPRRLSRSVREELEAQDQELERFKREMRDELKAIQQTYRNVGRTRQRTEELLAQLETTDTGDAPELEDEEVRPVDARGGQPNGVRAVPAHMVAAGIWGGGRSG